MKEKVLDWVLRNKRMVAIQLIFTVVLLGAVCLFLKPKTESTPKTATQDLFAMTTDVSEESGAKESKKTEEEKIYVDIKGAVKVPKMYEAKTSMRVNDIVEMAGGFLANAAVNQVNLAEIVVDQMVIFVPTLDEVASGAVQESGLPNVQQGAKESEKGKININTADAGELQKITGIGEKKALEIIKYREEKGSFKSCDELKNVSGIGEKTVEKIKDEICV